MKEQADNLPTIEQIIKISEMDLIAVDHTIWKQDQKPDFYLGMLAGLKCGTSAVIDIRESGDVDKADLWLMKMQIQAAKIVMDKYELKGFKV